MALFSNALYTPAHDDDVLVVACSVRRLRFWTGYHLRWNPAMQPAESVAARAAELQQQSAQLRRLIAQLAHAAVAAT